MTSFCFILSVARLSQVGIVLFYPFSCKVVSRWHRFGVSFQLQGFLKMASFCRFLSVARLSLDGIVLVFPFSWKVVSRWHRFDVSFQLQGCLTMASFWCFLSVARLSLEGIVLVFPFSCKVVSRWHRFDVCFQLQGCLMMASFWCLLSVARLSHDGIAVGDIHWFHRWYRVFDAFRRTNLHRSDNFSYRNVPKKHRVALMRYSMVDRNHVSIVLSHIVVMHCY